MTAERRYKAGHPARPAVLRVTLPVDALPVAAGRTLVAGHPACPAVLRIAAGINARAVAENLAGGAGALAEQAAEKSQE